MWSIFHGLVAVKVLATGAVRLRGLEYDYSHHGQDWRIGACASRDRQSPIDLPASASDNGAFSYQYSTLTRPFELQNNGHTLAADLAGQGYGGVYYENAWYNLMNINVHAQSEHTWMGATKPVELHIVHKRYDSDALLVIAIGVQAVASFLEVTAETHQVPAPAPAPAGPNLNPDGMYEAPSIDAAGFNPDVQAFLKVEPPDPKMKVLVPLSDADPFSLDNLIGQGASFYEYAGSLTAPPCAENVVWLVRRDSLTASAEQIRYIKDTVYRFTAEFGNYRSVMPLNGRMVYLRQARREDNPPTIAPEVPTLAPTQSDREMRAMKWAKDALKMAKSATEYIKDLDFRLRAAAQAHAEALSPQLPAEQVNLANCTNATSKAKAEIEQQQAMIMHAKGPTPEELEAMAKSMAATMAEAAKEKVEYATNSISEEAEAAARQAAIDASQLVESGAVVEDVH
mmetsp:Transcript_89722/g.155289  ORF Transcript_89722/g.155289 Transcript_89722/m.155289 type:complete len:455 (+) Transcript_89722:147-1511(+)